MEALNARRRWGEAGEAIFVCVRGGGVRGSPSSVSIGLDKRSYS
jgi:hypothetical protein